MEIRVVFCVFAFVREFNAEKHTEYRKGNPAER